MSNTPAPAIRDYRDEAAVDAAADLLRRGRTVAFPTETVYGLGADASQAESVARIFEAKGRPRFNPLIAHLPDMDAVRREVVVDTRVEHLAAAFWPGPLTMVLPRRSEGSVADLAAAGLATLAVRIPRHAVAQRLLRAVGRPVVAPSANASGRLSPTTAGHVAQSLGAAVDLILDGGACRVGVESTILDLSGPRPVLLRPGGISAEQIAMALGVAVDTAESPGKPKAPGQLESHYAPDRHVRLDARTVHPTEGLLAFGPVVPEGARMVRNLSAAGDLREAAANLFACLHALDRSDIAGIAVTPIPDNGLGAAINDRLRRAAAPRGT